MAKIHDDWLLDALGIDVRDYARQPMPTPEPTPVEGIRKPDGTYFPQPDGPPMPAPAPAPAQPAPPTPAQWRAQNKSAMDALQAATSRVVMPGPGQIAQGAAFQSWKTINGLLQAGDVQTATKLLTLVQPQVAIVTALPDAIATPTTPGKHPDQVLFGKETPALNVPGTTDTGDIMQTDVNQGQVGDCYLLAVVGDIAKMKPDIIRKMIKDNGDGTYTVTFYQHNGGLSGFFASLFGGSDFEAVLETVDSTFGSNIVNSGQGQAQVGNQHEVWVAVIEKAFAKLNGGYEKITHGGYPMNAMETLTGKKAGQKPIANVTVAELQADLAAGKPVVMDSLPQANPAQKLPFGLVGPHAYMLDSIQQTPQGPVIILKNPWGSQHPPPIPFNQLNQSIGWVETGSAL